MRIHKTFLEQPGHILIVKRIVMVSADCSFMYILHQGFKHKIYKCFLATSIIIRFNLSRVFFLIIVCVLCIVGCSFLSSGLQSQNLFFLICQNSERTRINLVLSNDIFLSFLSVLWTVMMVNERSAVSSCDDLWWLQTGRTKLGIYWMQKLSKSINSGTDHYHKSCMFTSV